MSDKTILLNNRFIGNTRWKMEIDLEELVHSAGKRKKDKYEGCTFIDYRLTQAKKLLKLIWEYGTEDDFRKMDEWMPKNPKLMKYWEDMK